MSKHKPNNPEDNDSVPEIPEFLQTPDLPDLPKLPPPRSLLEAQDLSSGTMGSAKALLAETPIEKDSGSLRTPLTAFGGEFMAVFASKQTPPPLTCTQGKVLLVDDDPDIIAILKIHLESEGLLVEQASTGQIALSKAHSFRPNLIVLDAIMPVMTGFEICGQLRKHTEFSQTPIIFLSSSEEEERMLEAYELGADDYVTKPFNAKTLSLKVKKAVERHQGKHAESVLVPGQRVAEHYKIQREIGRGGAGIVYLVKHEDTDILYALKTTLATTAMKERQRLEREIEVLQKIQHPHIVPVVVHQSKQTPPFYIMPYFAKGSLAEKLEHDGPLPIPKAVEITAQLASGLAQIHSLDLLHRDLKTDNVMFGNDDRPVLTDFGLAVSAHPSISRLTQTGMYAGTPRYMSPDQINSPQDLDGRSDIFSLGLLLYEMLVGYSPFQGMIASEIMVKLTTRDLPSPKLRRSEIPPEVEALCLQALQRNRNLRFPTAESFALACQDVLASLHA